MSRVIIKLSILFLLVQPAFTGEIPRILIELKTEATPVLQFENGARQYERYFGAYNSSRKKDEPNLHNLRIRQLKITVDGKIVPVEGWMYMDLANPIADTTRIYGNADRASAEFKVGSDAGNVFVVIYRIVPSIKGYRIIQRDVCNSEMKEDSCIRTIDNLWPYE